MDVNDICGTLYCNNDTTLGDIHQAIIWADAYLPYNWERETEDNWAYGHMRSIWRDRVYFSYKDIESTPVIRQPYAGDGVTNEHYCSHVTSEHENKVFLWKIIFDYLLHDAAVAYAHLAAEESNRRYASLACDLFQSSRQLRLDAQRAKLRKLQEVK